MAAVVANDVERLHHVLVVVQRLAHAHQHQVARPLQPAVVQEHRRAIATWATISPARRCRENPSVRWRRNAPEGAPGLGAEAGGEPAGIAHDDRLDLLSVGQAEQQLVGEAVLAGHGAGQLRQTGGEIHLQVFVQPAARRRDQGGTVVGAEAAGPW
ncbi:MAG: hypothetical protein U1G05_05920 [Kiritimatiellia bacterium]